MIQDLKRGLQTGFFSYGKFFGLVKHSKNKKCYKLFSHCLGQKPLCLWKKKIEIKLSNCA